MIDLAILGLLKEHDLHGYELRKRLGELPGWRPAVSFGSLYPALARLERAGMVKAVTHMTTPLRTPSAPMSGSLAGELAAFRALRRSAAAKGAKADKGKGTRGSRGKKVYGITQQGEEHFHELLVAPEVTDDREFAVRLAFCHHLAPAERMTLFQTRRDELVRRRDEQRQRGPGTDRRVTTYLRSLLERDTEAITADLAWLDRLIASETADHEPGGKR